GEFFDLDGPRHDLCRLRSPAAADDTNRGCREIEVLLEGLEIVRCRLAVLADNQETLFQVSNSPTPLQAFEIDEHLLGDWLLPATLTHREVFSTEGIAR